LAFLFVNQAIITEYLIEPIAKLVWLFIHVLQSIDQKVYWVLLVIAAAIMALFLLPENVDKHDQTAYQEYPIMDDRLSFWKKLFKSAKTNFDDRKKLLDKLCEINNSFREVKDTKNIEDLSSQNDIFPPLNKKVQMINRIFPHRRKKSMKQYDLYINEFLESLEKDMEGKHE
jgi:hypothetical protein